MKLSPNVDSFSREDMEIYAEWCGRALALSHARSGRSAMITGYLGKSDAFDVAMAALHRSPRRSKMNVTTPDFRRAW